ncbi:MAG: metallophosphoesterase family protein [Balneolaceae bacterium]
MSKIAIISDIHGNLAALEAVLEKLEKENPDIWLCLGDIVGYGPYPKECIDLVRKKDCICVLGNHDAGVAGLLSIKHFRNPNQRLIELTKTLIDDDQMEWLKSLPMKIDTEIWTAVHASPIEPHKWKYLDSAFTVRKVLETIEQKICFVGHTHRPSIVSNRIGINTFRSGLKYIINPGSVGQSRDDDYRASCSIVDVHNWKYENFRIEYDNETTRTALMKLGFSRDESLRLLKF